MSTQGQGRKVTLTETVRAQVALLFGKFRPAGNLAPSELAAVRAERIEFADRLVALVRGIEAQEPAVIQEVRRVAREVFNEQFSKMPSAEDLCARVKHAFQTKLRAPCFGCQANGGWLPRANPDEPPQRVFTGEIEFAPLGWLCVGHSEAVTWYAQREARRRGLPGLGGCPRIFAYPPPACLLPRGGRPADGPPEDPTWTAYTDGANMGVLARWAVALVGDHYGWTVGETETPLLEGAAEAVDDELWRSL